MRLAPFCLVLAAAAALAQPKSDWERDNEERLKQLDEAVVRPPALRRGRLVEIETSLPSDFRFYVDAGSVSVGSDRIVRYVVVARSPSGVETVTFEGLRCPAEYRIYAAGRADGSWSGRAGEWRPVPPDGRAARNALARRYFCPARRAVESAEEGAQALRAGGHPAALIR